MLNLLKNIDYTIFHFINQTISNSVFDFILPLLRDAKNWIPLYIFLAVYLVRKYKIEAVKYALYLAIAFALADSISYHILKPWFCRLRPCHSLTFHVRLVLGHCGGNWSFPSSHASNHMAIAMSIILANIFTKKWINYIWIFWALTIGFSQIYVGVHYPGDILAGFIFGILIACFNYFIILRLLNKLHKKFTGNNN